MEKIRLKPCSPLLMIFFIGAVLLHQITNGYGSLICLLLAFFVMVGQSLLQKQLHQDLEAIKSALKVPSVENNQQVLALTQRLLTENQWLTEDSKKALFELQQNILESQRS